MAVFNLMDALSLPASMFSPPGAAYPMVIAAHPSEPNQIALGMSDGAVHVVEPPDADPNWGSAHPHDGNGAVPTISPNHALNGNQVSEPHPSR
ncbi:hypothetical protein B296_00048841 [Ensete ventricosum]|uniref:Uncharacterized protein n=1 Tax=Ensete ventricosum TaxID=4639 RepID=A0A426X8C4_ENSVE|nr:hypothetical protein B296_00048841 [Ensete ventricosum]